MPRAKVTTLVFALAIIAGCATQHAPLPARAANNARPNNQPAPATTSAQSFPVVDYAQEWVRLNEEALPPEGRLPDAENAWPLFMQWLKDFRREEALAFGWSPTERDPFRQQSPDEYQDSPFFSLYDTQQPSTEEAQAARQTAKAALAKLEQTDLFPRLQRLAAMPRLVRPKSTSETLIGDDFAELSGIRGAIRALTARLTLRLDDGDIPSAVDCFEQGLAIARVSRYEPMSTAAVMASACESLLLQAVRTHSQPKTWPPLELDRAAWALQSHVAGTPPWSHAMRADLIMAKDSVQHVYLPFGTPDAPTPSQMVEITGSAADMDEEIIDQARSLAEGFQSCSETMDLADHLYQLAASTIDTPRYIRDESELYRVEKIAAKNQALSIVMVDFYKVLISADAERTEVNGARIMFAIEQYRFKHHALPERLADLVPEFLDAIPIDPFDDTGFTYKRVDAAVTPRGYLLYSIGRDGQDNDGAEHPTTNVWALTAREGDGYDYVVVGPSAKP